MRSLVLDHAVINTLGDLDGVGDLYRRLGFALTPRGYHTLGSINHLAVFGENYLELLGYAPGEREKRAELWVHPIGLTGLAFRSDDSATLHREMTERGAKVEALKDFSRPVKIDGKEIDAAFRTFQIDRSLVENGRIFFCQHRTPELIWRDENLSHPNGVQNVTEFAIAANDISKVAEALGQVPGLLLKRREQNLTQFGAGVATITLATPDRLRGRFGDRIWIDATDPLRMVALHFVTASLAAARGCLGDSATEFEGGLIVG
ncbi:VOC family protein, partial [Rhizobiaceae sp. 2RAB30]